MTCVLSVTPIKNFILNNPRWRTADTLEKFVLHHRNLWIFKTAAVLYLGILKMKFLTANHLRNMFCVIKLNFVEMGRMCCRDVAFFVFFKLRALNMA